MSIVTKTGDKGTTSLLGGQRVPKTDLRIEAYGTVDELNASIGVALNYVKEANVKEILDHVQNDLFRIGAELAALETEFKKFPKITPQHTDRIEQEVHMIEKNLPKQTQFILPNGKNGAAHLHLARTICRRAERRVLACNASPEIIQYLNRLSDLLFIYARLENKGEDVAVKYE